MSVDNKPVRTWKEEDLQQLCDESRREAQWLEFKGELKLDSDKQRNDAEHDAQGLATGGGGVIVYGIAETTLPDGAKAAGRLQPLRDGTLHDRLQEVLDSRGQPRLPFELHEVPAADGGFYLLLEVFGHRRPHQAQDGRYYGRRGTRVRQMQEAEVAEAYRDRMLRDYRALEPLTRGEDADGFPPDVEARIHRGLRPAELALRREATGESEPPGWMSVVVVPMPPQRGLLDPVRDARKFQRPIHVPERWDTDHWPLQYFQLEPSQHGLVAQLPPRDDVAPAYLVAAYRDGLMEYGTTLEPALRRQEPAENRIIFSLSHPFQAHDYLQAFAVALGELGYEGDVAAQVSFEHTQGVRLGVDPGRDVHLHRIKEPHIRSEVWRLPRRDLLEQAGRVVKQAADGVWLAAGVPSGCWLIDESGNLDKSAQR